MANLQKTVRNIAAAGVLFFLLSPVALVFAAQSCPADYLVPCGCDQNNNGVIEMAAGGYREDCEYADFIELARRLIDFLIFKLASPLAAVMFAYAGFLYLTNKGNESQAAHAKEIFWYVFVGLVVALGAWLTVNFILSFLVGTGSPFNLLG